MSFWLVVIAPGHTRGVIQLDSSCETNTAIGSIPVDAYCSTSKPKRDSKTDESPSNDAPKDAAANCAICYLNTSLQLTATIPLTLPEVGLIAELSPLPIAGIHSELHVKIKRSRDPPFFI